MCSFLLPGILVSVGCHNQIPRTRWVKQQAFISHDSGGWEVQDQVVADLFSWWGPSAGCSWPPSHCVLTCSHLGSCGVKWMEWERGKNREKENRETETEREGKREREREREETERSVWCVSFFLKYIYWYAITVVPFPPSLYSILPTPSLPHSPL